MNPMPRTKHSHAAAFTLAIVCAASPLLAATTSASDPGNPPSLVTTAPPAPAADIANPPAAAIVLSEPQHASDPCSLPEVNANPTRPAWDYAASSTQCGVAEVDSGWQQQPMGAGVSQWMMLSSLRYGLTPRLDLRWGFTGHIHQSGGGTASLQGIGDQWLNLRYRFVEQQRIVPAMALLYGYKIPTANPAKGFGTGFVDHQLVFVASRDLGHYHFDFNTVATIAGVPGAPNAPAGHASATQFGLALTRPVTPRLSLILESYGGPQPGIPGRFGAVFGGVTYAVRPSLVFDSAYTRTYTAGTPRAQLLIGVTRALRPGFAPMPKGSYLAHLLGR